MRRALPLLLWLFFCCAPALAQEAASAAPEREGLPQPLPASTDLRDLPPVVAPPVADEMIDMTPFQQAFDKEVAEAQAEATGATANLPGSADGGGSDLMSLALRSLAVLLGICGTIIVLGWVARRWGGNTPILAGAGLAQVLGRVYLEPKVSLHFVKTGGRVIVVGVTSGTASLITEFEADQFEQSLGITTQPAEAPRVVSAESGFMARLREQQEKSATPPAAGDDLDSLRGDIQRLKQFLQESRRGSDL